MNAPQMQKLPDGRQAMLALQALIAANRDLAEAVGRVADAILAEEGVTIAERGLLLLVRRHRALPIPRLAEHRGVSRQHMRVAVRGLVEKGRLEFRPNPAHKRSKLVALTPAGVDLVKRIMAREGEVMARVAAQLDPGATKTAAEMLNDVLGKVEGE